MNLRTNQVALLAIVTAILLMPAALDAQWSALTDANTPVCTIGGDQTPLGIVTDEAGGAIIGWLQGSGLSLQRLSAQGVALWGPVGIQAAAVRSWSDLVSDHAGGVLIAGWDVPSSSGVGPLLHRYGPAGSLLFATRITEGAPVDVQIVPDLSGGGILVWLTTGGQAMVARVDAGGGHVWGPQILGNASTFKSLQDGSGGAIIALNGGGYRISPAGVQLWPGGVALASGPLKAFVPDGTGGVIALYGEFDPTIDADMLRGRRISPTGLVLWDRVLNWYNDQTVEYRGVSDEAGGAIFTWEEEGWGVRAMRVTGTGERPWSIIKICDEITPQRDPMIAGSSGGGAIVAWTDMRTGAADLYAQRLNADGTPQWTPNGIPVTTAPGEQDHLVATTDGMHGFIAAWEDRRTGTQADVYAQRLDELGYQCNALVANPGFEGSPAPWKFFTNGSGSFGIDVPGQASPHAACIQITGEGSNVQLYTSGLSLEPNSVYRLSFWGYSASGHDVSLSIHKHTAPYTPYGLTAQAIDLTSSWKMHFVEFTTAGLETAVADGRLRFWLAPFDAVGDRYFFDHILLWKMTPVLGLSITQQPADASVLEGQQAMFAVIATGTGRIDYQWEKNGAPIAGAQNRIYWTPSATLADNGTVYRCRVASPYSTLLSEPATLTVTGSPFNAIVNASFESGTEHWKFFTNGTGSFAAAGPGYADATAAKIVITDAGTNSQLYQSDVALDWPGEPYMLSFVAKSTTGHDLSVSLIKHGPPYTSYGLSNRTADLSPAWRVFSYVFTVPPLEIYDARLRFAFNGFAAAGDVYSIDNVVLVPVNTYPKSTPVADTPTEVVLHQNYPNPFNPSTRVRFDLPEPSTVSLAVFDLLGRKVADLAAGEYEAGYHSATWNAAGAASGVYLARFTATSATGNVAYTKTHKLLLMK